MNAFYTLPAADAPPVKAPQIKLRIRECMARAGIKSVASLHRALNDHGVEISHAQLMRVVDNTAVKLSVPVLNALLVVMHCSVAEMIGEA